MPWPRSDGPRPFGIVHRSWRDARTFYASFAGLVVVAAGIVLIPQAPLGLITLVQALAGVLRPSATVFLLVLCNDRAVLGPWTNALWLNGLASLIVTVDEWMASTLTPALAAPVDRRGGRRLSARGRARRTWRMPPLSLLERPVWSRGRRAAMIALRGYLVVAVLPLVVKAVQLLLGH